MMDDKQIEFMRYDERARTHLSDSALSVGCTPSGVEAMPQYLRSPYYYYYKKISAVLAPNMRVLELGAGTGSHTRILVESGADVVATDISPHSLEILKKNLSMPGGCLDTQVADMEALPFESDSFDVVACAGSLSYGDPYLVDAEIRRVLKKGGSFVCVDSLHHNPVYRFNRWINYKRGNRSKSTLLRMPTLDRIASMAKGFADVEVKYFGAASFCMPILAYFLSGDKVLKLSDRIDQFFSAKKSAFKFVLVAEGLRK